MTRIIILLASGLLLALAGLSYLLQLDGLALLLLITSAAIVLKLFDDGERTIPVGGLYRKARKERLQVATAIK